MQKRFQNRAACWMGSYCGIRGIAMRRGRSAKELGEIPLGDLSKHTLAVLGASGLPNRPAKDAIGDL